MFLLASSSPRRRDLLHSAGYPFRVQTASVTELEEPTEGIEKLVQGNAHRKASAVSELHPDHLVLGADTLVALQETPFGKPRDLDHALEMLEQLVGRTHRVVTGVCMRRASDAFNRQFAETTWVTFRPLSRDQIQSYLSMIQPLDKAGAYAAQDHGEFIIESFEGSWSNVVGLPLERLGEELAELGIHPSTTAS